MSKTQRYPLYELSEQEFLRLCIDLLVAADPNLRISTAETPRWIDAVGNRISAKGNESVAVEISHRITFHPEGLRLFLERLSKEERKFNEYIFITSSPIQDIHRQLINSKAALALNANIQILGQEEVIRLLQDHAAVAQNYFKTVRARVKFRKWAASISSIALAISLAGLANGLFSFYEHKKQPQSQLSEQVKSVEESLARLKGLEQNLKTLKQELQNKAEESARVTKEYEEAMKLRSLTVLQLNQIKKAVNSQSGFDIFMNYFFGFLLGVASSVLATIITDRWKKRKALTKPYA